MMMEAQRFNLLPHRQMANNFALRVLLRQIAAIALLAVICATVGAFGLNLRTEQISAVNRTLGAGIDQVLPDYRSATQLQSRYAQLLQRQQLIETLDARRSISVLLLADVADALPQDIYLIRLEENGERIGVEGRAVDSSAIARFMEKLSASAYLADVSLNEISVPDLDQEGLAPYRFSIIGRVILQRTDVRAVGGTGNVR